MCNNTNDIWPALVKFDAIITDVVLNCLLFMGFTDFCLGRIGLSQCGYVLGSGLLMVRRHRPQWFPKHYQEAKF